MTKPVNPQMPYWRTTFNNGEVEAVARTIRNERKPDYVVVLAWRFAEPFINKNLAYLKAGGCFVIPVPEFKVITNV